MKSFLIHRSQLEAHQRDSMFGLLSTHFHGTSRSVFDADLAEKNWVLLLTDAETGRLRGFTTLLLYDVRVNDTPWNIVYSGDTIVEPTAWRSMTLPQAWIGALNHLRRTYGKQSLYWLLLVSGYRTYRFLPVFMREFYPRYDTPTPLAVRDTVQRLARDRFGSRYDLERGVVRFENPQVLRPELSGIPPERRRDPHIDFFARVNPGHEQGDELVCFTQLEQSNMTRAGLRMWRAGETLFQTAEQPT